MRDISKIVKLKVLMALFGLLVFIWSVLCISSIRTCIRIKNPKEITGKDSPFLKSGKVVSIEYDYFFDGRFVSGFALGRDHYYEILKISTKEEFLYCKFIGENISFLDDKPFYQLYREIKEQKSEDKNLFLGKVRKTNKSIKEVFIEKVMKPKEGLYKIPNTLTDTNVDYYIQYIEPEEERSRMLGRITFWGILLISCMFLLKKFRQEQSAYLFYLNEERINQKRQYRIAVEKQLKESGKQGNSDDSEQKSDGM